VGDSLLFSPPYFFLGISLLLFNSKDYPILSSVIYVIFYYLIIQFYTLPARVSPVFLLSYSLSLFFFFTSSSFLLIFSYLFIPLNQYTTLSYLFYFILLILLYLSYYPCNLLYLYSNFCTMIHLTV
jgi:hypothetical protein